MDEVAHIAECALVGLDLGVAAGIVFGKPRADTRWVLSPGMLASHMGVTETLIEIIISRAD